MVYRLAFPADGQAFVSGWDGYSVDEMPFWTAIVVGLAVEQQPTVHVVELVITATNARLAPPQQVLVHVHVAKPQLPLSCYNELTHWGRVIEWPA